MMPLLLLRRRAKPLLDLSFSGGGLPPGLTFTRASAGWAFDSAGVRQQAATNAPRFDCDPVTLAIKGLLIEEQRTNYIKYNSMAGAVAGTPGTLPPPWSVNYNPANLSWQVVATGTENGMPYIDFRVYGTATGGTQINLQPEANANPAAQGEVWTFSSYVKLIAGSFSNLSPAIKIDEAATGFLAGGAASYTPTSTLARYSYTRTVTNAATTKLQPQYQFVTTAGQTVDATFRLYAPQIEKSSAATSSIPTNSVSVTRAADVLQFTIPSGVSTLRYLFDNDSTQDVAVSAGAYTVPTTLNRSRIKRIWSPQ